MLTLKCRVRKEHACRRKDGAPYSIQERNGAVYIPSSEASPFSRYDRDPVRTKRDLLEELTRLFIGKKDAFADYFYDFFHDMEDTRPFLDEEKQPGHMKRVWAGWFASFFRSKPDDEFLAYLWGVGVRHVEVSLDQRFSNLGFAMIRQFCHKIVAAEVPPGTEEPGPLRHKQKARSLSSG